MAGSPAASAYGIAHELRPEAFIRWKTGTSWSNSIRPINIGDITGELARESGFKGVIDLLKTGKHGTGTNFYLINFRYLAGGDIGPR